MLHLHRLENQNDLALRDRVAAVHESAADPARHRRDEPGVGFAGADPSRSRSSSCDASQLERASRAPDERTVALSRDAEREDVARDFERHKLAVPPHFPKGDALTVDVRGPLFETDLPLRPIPLQAHDPHGDGAPGVQPLSADHGSAGACPTSPDGRRSESTIAAAIQAAAGGTVSSGGRRDTRPVS